MRIGQSDLTLTSHQASSSESWQTLQLEEVSPSALKDQFATFFNQELTALTGHSAPSQPATDIQTGDKERRFQSLWEMLFGQPAASHTSSATTASDPACNPASQAVSTPASLQLLVAMEHTKTTESCSFNASGKVCLADGSTRQFEVGYQNEQSSETTRFAGQMLLKDPLVLDLGPATTKLSSQSVAFDLDNNGTQESMRLPDTGSGLLFLDRNHNGTADNGSELFGPQSGNGFSELAKLDTDHNGWIDEADPGYQDLKLWQSGDQPGGKTQTLSEARIGALATQSVSTEYGLSEKEEILGQIRASSIWLGEHGGAGSVRQIDLATKPIS
ncbi:MAG: hypothetical protein ACRCU9_11415 [Iodobacter sp.]